MWWPTIAPAEAKPDPAIGAAVPWIPWSVPIGPGFRLWPTDATIAPPRLHPDDVEAIARRVAELLRGVP